jgi:hypothetical protein
MAGWQQQLITNGVTGRNDRENVELADNARHGSCSYGIPGSRSRTYLVTSLCYSCWLNTSLFVWVGKQAAVIREKMEDRKIIYIYIYIWSRGSSVSIVSDYRLNDRAIEVRSPADAKDISFNLCVQTGSGAHPASCTMGTGGPFLGVKRGRGVTLTTHPHLVPRSRMSRSYTSSRPQAPPWRVAGLLYLYI